MAYMAGHCTDKLIALLNRTDFDSYVLSALKVELIARGFNWNTPEGRLDFDRLLDFINFRIYRGGGKSSVITHGGIAWCVTVDPNDTIALMSVNDDGAAAFCRQVRDTLNTDLYRLFFPERIPEGDLTKLWTERHIVMGGRTSADKEGSIEARGFWSSWARTHFNKFWLDDIITEANCGEADTKELEGKLGASLRGLYKPMFGGSRVWRRHVGTVWAEKDDHSILRKIETCCTIVVPIEVYAGGITPEDMSERGTPTNPEWHDAEYVKATFKETIVSEEGALGYKRNFWLDPLANAGDREFPRSLVERAKYKIERHNNQIGLWREERDEAWAVVPAKDKAGKPIVQKVDEAGKPVYQLARVFIELRGMRVVLGIDPAYAEGGDDWGITALGTDFQECSYQLETHRGKGWDALVLKMLALIEKWDPAEIGYEAAAAQEQNFKTLLEFNRRFRRHRNKFVPVRHRNVEKVYRIRNRVAEPMRLGRLRLNPGSIALHEEMKSYVPGPKAIDNQLDSVAIAMSIARRSRASGDWKKSLEERERLRKAKRIA